MTVDLATPETRAWCEQRNHPWVTYNPWLDESFCRCGQMREAGEKPMNWQAKREQFHTCRPGDPCRCYLT